MEMRNGWRTHAPNEPGLRGAVVGYHGYERLHSGLFTDRLLDEPVTSIVLLFGGTPNAATAAAQLSAMALPPDPADVTGVIDLTCQAVQIDLTPIGAGRILGVSAEKLNHVHHEVAAVLGAETARLLGRLASATSWHTRFAAVDRFLMARLQNAPARSLSVGTAWRRFAETSGVIVIGDLAPRLAPEAPAQVAAVAAPEASHVHRHVVRPIHSLRVP
jgi:hypothetical protein